MTCPERREFFVPKLQYFRSFKYIQVKQNILDNHCPAMSYHTDEFKKKADELLYTGSVARYGPQSVASATWLRNIFHDWIHHVERLVKELRSP